MINDRRVDQAFSDLRSVCGGVREDYFDYRDKAAEGNLSFLRTDHAFDNCMEIAHKKWYWVHKKLA